MTDRTPIYISKIIEFAPQSTGVTLSIRTADGQELDLHIPPAVLHDLDERIGLVIEQFPDQTDTR
jgi:hypothetical protein